MEDDLAPHGLVLSCRVLLRGAHRKMRLRLYGESAEPRLRSRHLPEQYEKDLTIKVKRHRRDWFQLLLGHDDQNEK